MERDEGRYEGAMEDHLAADQDVGGRMSGGFLAGVVLGAVLGASVALLLAPDSGGQTRRRLGRRARSLRARALEELDDATRERRRDLSRRRRRLRGRLRNALDVG